MRWLETVRMPSPAQQYVFSDHLAQLHHQAERLQRLEQTVLDQLREAPPWQKVLMDALVCLRGVKELTAATVLTEAGPLSWFDKAPQLMSYAGLVPSEHSSGGLTGEKRGRITKAGNAHLRRVLLEAAWSYSRPVRNRGPVVQRRLGKDPVVVQMAVTMGGMRRRSKRKRAFVGSTRG